MLVNPRALRNAAPTIGDAPLDMKKLDDFQTFPDDLRASEFLHIGRPGRDQLNKVVLCAQQNLGVSAIVMVPELPCDPWCPILERLSHHWCGVEPRDNETFWMSRSGEKFRPAITWWIVRIHPRN